MNFCNLHLSLSPYCRAATLELRETAGVIFNHVHWLFYPLTPSPSHSFTLSHFKTRPKFNALAHLRAFITQRQVRFYTLQLCLAH